MSPERRAGLLVAVLTLLLRPAAAQQFDVGGRAEADGEELRVVVELRNRADAVARDVSLVGELDSHEASSAAAVDVPPRGRVDVPLSFPDRVTRPGLHAVILRIAFRPGSPPAQGEVPLLHQLSFLGFPLGAQPPPAVELRVPPAEVGWSGDLEVEVTPLDGIPHRLSLRAITAPGLRAYPERREFQLEPGAPLRVPLRLLRSGGSATLRHGALVEARVLDGPLERTAVAVAEVRLTASRGWLPEHRTAVLVLALTLLAAALLIEVRRLRG